MAPSPSAYLNLRGAVRAAISGPQPADCIPARFLDSTSSGLATSHEFSVRAPPVDRTRFAVASRLQSSLHDAGERGVNMRIVGAGDRWIWASIVLVLSTWLLRSFLESLLWAFFIAIATWPLYRRFSSLRPLRAGPSARALL